MPCTPDRDQWYIFLSKHHRTPRGRSQRRTEARLANKRSKEGEKKTNTTREVDFHSENTDILGTGDLDVDGNGGVEGDSHTVMMEDERKLKWEEE